MKAGKTDEICVRLVWLMVLHQCEFSGHERLYFWEKLCQVHVRLCTIFATSYEAIIF